MGKHQLFKKVPSKDLALRLLNCFNFKDFDDRKCICKKYFKRMKVIENVTKLLPELKEHYLPCKSKTYLNKEFINNNSVMTILRQILRTFNYVIVSREKYINGEKLINYSLVNKTNVKYKPIIPNDKTSSFVLTFN